jgi:hypothetical protein
MSYTLTKIMKAILPMLFGVLFFAACNDNKEVSGPLRAALEAPQGVYRIPSAYWYSFDLFSGNIIFIGSLSITDQKPNDHEGTTTAYRFTVTEIITSSADVEPEYKIGDVIESETFRKVVDGSSHALCFSRYPEGKDGETVIDGGFPLHIDDKVRHALQLIRIAGFNPEEYSEEDYNAIRGLLRDPEMHDFHRERKKER